MISVYKCKNQEFSVKNVCAWVFLLLFLKFPSIQEESLPNTYDQKYNQKIVIHTTTNNKIYLILRNVDLGFDKSCKGEVMMLRVSMYFYE